MARCPLVRPETVRVSLGDDEYLELKKELTAGEYRQMIVMQFKESSVGADRMSVDLHNVGISKILGYLTDWSFVDWNGQPLGITREIIEKLDQATYQDVLAAIDAHHDSCEQEMEARKNARNGESKSAPISPSVK